MTEPTSQPSSGQPSSGQPSSGQASPVTSTRNGLLLWLGELVSRKGSDLYLTYGAPPMVRVHDELVPISPHSLDAAMINKIIGELTTHEQQGEFYDSREFNMSLDLGRLGRFRVNLLYQRQHQAVVIRRIDTVIPDMGSLGLPDILATLAQEKRGLILFVGGTGSGKSTSMAAMIDYRNQTTPGHILTIEDPIEYIHEHKKSLVTQREVGVDTKSYDAALKNSLRQKPDVILIGEIRDREVMRHAINICETGHLAMATLHANNSAQAIERIVSFFDVSERHHVLLNLSFNIRAIISQRLVRRKGGGRVLAHEILVNNEGTSSLIRDGRIADLKAAIAGGQQDGMMGFNGSLLSLYRRGLIDAEVATAESDDRKSMVEAIENCS